MKIQGHAENKGQRNDLVGGPGCTPCLSVERPFLIGLGSQAACSRNSQPATESGKLARANVACPWAQSSLCAGIKEIWVCLPVPAHGEIVGRESWSLQFPDLH